MGLLGPLYIGSSGFQRKFPRDQGIHSRDGGLGPPAYYNNSKFRLPPNPDNWTTTSGDPMAGMFVLPNKAVYLLLLPKSDAWKYPTDAGGEMTWKFCGACNGNSYGTQTSPKEKIFSCGESPCKGCILRRELGHWAMAMAFSRYVWTYLKHLSIFSSIVVKHGEGGLVTYSTSS